MNIRKIGALAAASMLAIGVVGVASAASVTPTEHSGNITSEGTYKADCPDGFSPLTVDGDKTSGTWGGVTVTVTYHDGTDKSNSLDFSVSGGWVSVAFVKGGPNYNEYDYAPPVTWDNDLVAPLVGNDNVPTISHSVYCVKPNEEQSAPPESEAPSSPPESAEPSSPPESAAPSEEASSEPSEEASSEPSAEPSSEPSGGVGGETSSPSESAAPSESTAPSGGVGGETDTPTAPPTDQNGITSSSAPTLPLLLVILGVIGLGAVVLTPRRARR